MKKLKFGNILFNVLTIITTIAVSFMIFNFVFGAKGYSVTSDSMKPSFSRGDAVYSRKVSFDELSVGDIVTVRVGNEGYFSHRIVEIDRDDMSITTKGDANDSEDPMKTSAENIAGRVWYVVPYIGFISILIPSFSNMKIVIVLVVVAAVLIVINMVLSKNNKKRGDCNE